MNSKYDHWIAQRTTESNPSTTIPRRGVASVLQATLDLPRKLFRFFNHARSNPRDGRRIIQRWLVSHLTNPLSLIILAWICILYLGESSSFNRAIADCEWSQWEEWPSQATPHHLVLIADPQLVDPHTYPGRPWPISTLTIKHTDLYLRRTFSRIEQVLDPSTVVFLGDLFDGGREWSTTLTQSPEEQYRSYGDSFWHQELGRFKSIFLREWSRNAVDSDRQIITSLPGNHDLGFGKGIQKPVRDRFIAAFGDVNRVDVIANHTFVSLDTVSLSAMESDIEASATDIWKPTNDFLAGVMIKQAHAIEKSLHPDTKLAVARQAGQTEKEAIFRNRPRSTLDIPTILLTHVPLYRAPGTPCGSLRERHPPSTPPPGQTKPVFPDDRNAISVSDGYQYQNVLSDSLTRHIISKLGNDIEYAFSGDDHDYCEVLHSDFPSKGGRGILEITVKSISWAMGVRKPGFLLVSLWNPVDHNGRSLHSSTNGEKQRTMQTHLCLLPDQLGIFIRYATFFGLSVLLLLLRATVIVLRIPFLSASASSTSYTSIPLSNTTPPTTTRRRAISSAEREKQSAPHHPQTPPSSSSAYPNYPGASSSKASPSPDDATLSARLQGRPRSVPSMMQHTTGGFEDVGQDNRWEEESLYGREADGNAFDVMDAGFGGERGRGRRVGSVRMVLAEWGWGVWCVGRVAGLWFILLLFWA